MKSIIQIITQFYRNNGKKLNCSGTDSDPSFDGTIEKREKIAVLLISWFIGFKLAVRKTDERHRKFKILFNISNDILLELKKVIKNRTGRSRFIGYYVVKRFKIQKNGF